MCEYSNPYDQELGDVLAEFKKGRAHMAVVTEDGRPPSPVQTKKTLTPIAGKTSVKDCFEPRWPLTVARTS